MTELNGARDSRRDDRSILGNWLTDCQPWPLGCDIPHRQSFSILPKSSIGELRSNKLAVIHCFGPGHDERGVVDNQKTQIPIVRLRIRTLGDIFLEHKDIIDRLIRLAISFCQLNRAAGTDAEMDTLPMPTLSATTPPPFP